MRGRVRRSHERAAACDETAECSCRRARAQRVESVTLPCSDDKENWQHTHTHTRTHTHTQTEAHSHSQPCRQSCGGGVRQTEARPQCCVCVCVCMRVCIRVCMRP